jgi:rhodanese-related sulfurtransferase
MEMKRVGIVFMVFALAVVLAAPAYAADEWVKKFNDILMKGPAENNWQVTADDVAGWMKAKKTDFVLVDARPVPPGQQGGKMHGAIFIPYNEILKADNLAKLPKNKKVVLVCVTGQTQNLPVVALRALGYDARTMAFGHAAWIKGYFGAQFMQQAIQNAGAKNFPVEK